MRGLAHDRALDAQVARAYAAGDRWHADLVTVAKGSRAVARIFLSHYRDDAPMPVDRLREDLARRYGRDEVVEAPDRPVLGDDASSPIRERVSACDVLLVIIGPGWLSVLGRTRTLAADNSGDGVRMAVATALSAGLPIVPVQVQDAPELADDDLPDDLRDLARLDSQRLREETWQADVRRLTERIDREIEEVTPKDAPHVVVPASAPMETPSADAPSHEADAGERPYYLDEDVQFTVYRPRAVRPAAWYSMLAFAHLSEPRPGTDDPDPIEEVQAQARHALGGAIDEYQHLSQDSAFGVPREGELTFCLLYTSPSPRDS